eukprot:274725_1
MSFKTKTSKSNIQDNEILKYCPNYKQYDRKTRNECKTRIEQHLLARRDGVINCVDQAIKEFKILDIPIKNDAPKFIHHNKIMNNASKQITIKINKWDGVQLGKFKTQTSKGEIIIIDSFQKFS